MIYANFNHSQWLAKLCEYITTIELIFTWLLAKLPPDSLITADKYRQEIVFMHAC